MTALIDIPENVLSPTVKSPKVTFGEVMKVVKKPDVVGKHVFVLDVRSRGEFADGHLDGAHNIPHDQMEAAFALDPDAFEAKFGFAYPKHSTVMVLLCHAGVRAKMAFDYLHKLGFSHIKLYTGGWGEITAPLMRLRKKAMKPFGKALDQKPSAATEGGSSDLVAIERSAAIQLGALDPLQKAAVDEITTLMQGSQQIAVVSPTAKRMKAKQAELDAKSKAEQAASASSKPVLTKAEGEGLTWAQAKALKEQQNAAAAASGVAAGGGSSRPDRATVDKDGKPIKRTGSGGVIDPLVVRVRNLADVTANELQRMFGSENGLGEIARMFLLADKGMAYITYKNERDAAQAIAKMDKRKFKFLILAVDHGTKREGGPGKRR